MIEIVLVLSVGQILAFSPSSAHPIAYYFAFALGVIAICGVVGILLRRGTPRID